MPTVIRHQDETRAVLTLDAVVAVGFRA